jgi:rod shape-determining protein MreC
MALPDIRQRAGLLFLAVVVGHIVLISAQVNSRSGMPLLQTVVFGAVSQLQRVTAGIVVSVQESWADYVDLRNARTESEALKRRMAELELKLLQQHSQIEEVGRLQRLLDLRQRLALPTTAARIIAGSASPDFRTVTIDKGRGQGLRDYMAVLAPEGVVGRVVTPGIGTSKVQLLVDRNAAAAALVERSRAEGIVMGTGTDLLRMEYLAATADIRPGDVVVTSGMDGVYPKGFPIGRVERVERAGISVKAAVVRPAVDYWKLEEVLVATAPPEGGGAAQ